MLGDAQAQNREEEKLENERKKNKNSIAQTTQKLRNLLNSENLERKNVLLEGNLK